MMKLNSFNPHSVADKSVTDRQTDRDVRTYLIDMVSMICFGVNSEKQIYYDLLGFK